MKENKEKDLQYASELFAQLTEDEKNMVIERMQEMLTVSSDEKSHRQRG